MSLPKYSHSLFPPNPNDQIWYRWFTELEAARLSGAIGTEAITAIAYILGSPDGTVANIPPLSTDLPLLNDTGVGLALLKITRDIYGRVEGTESATTDDLSEGTTNLYFTDQRARDATILASQVFGS
jgi:hypothetical protein